MYRSFAVSYKQPAIFLLRILFHSNVQNDGSLVATADHGGSVRLWDLRSGQVVYTQPTAVNLNINEYHYLDCWYYKLNLDLHS